MRTKWIYTILVLALGFFASCNNEADEAAGNKKTRTIVFRLAVDDAVGSRAQDDWSTNDNPVVGTGIENRIDLNGLRVAIYSIVDGKAHTRVGRAEHLLYWPIKNSITDSELKYTDVLEYELVGDISDVHLEKDKEYRFMVYANFPHSDNNLFDVEDVNGENGYIPMWGVATKKITDAELEDLGVIRLLRAAAKVEVTFADDIKKDYSISRAIRNYSEKGEILPKGWAECVETSTLDMEKCINVTGEHSHVDGSILPFDTNKDYIYLPEFANTADAHSDPEHKSVVQVTLEKDGLLKTYDISFCSYNADGTIIPETEYDIVRNHIYRFHVIEVQGSNLLVKFKVADWIHESLQSGQTENDHNLNLGGLGYPTYVNPLLPSKNYNYPQEKINTTPEMTYVDSEDQREKNAFTAYFNYIGTGGSYSAAGYPWMPNIVDGSKDDYQIKVYDVNNNNEQLVYDSKIKTDQDLKSKYTGWFKILVIPLNPAKNAAEINLAISSSVHPSGFPSENFFLFINGQTDNIAWPNSGEDNKFIKILQK